MTRSATFSGFSSVAGAEMTVGCVSAEMEFTLSLWVMVPAIEHAGVKNARNTDRNADMISFIENTSFVFGGVLCLDIMRLSKELSNNLKITWHFFEKIR